MCENGTSCNILALIEHGIKFDPCCRTIYLSATTRVVYYGHLLPPWSSAVGPRQGIILVAEEAGSGEGINELAGIIGGRFMGDLVATL